MQLHQVDLSQIRHIFPPFLPISLRNQIGDVITLHRLAVLLDMPVKFLYLQLQLLNDLLLLSSKAYSTELFLLQLDLVLLLSPELLRNGHQSMRQKDNHQKHPERIRCSHQHRSQLLQVQLVLQGKVHYECHAQYCEYPIDDEIVDEGSLKFLLGSELACSLVLLRYWQQQPGEYEDEVVDDLPDDTHGVVALQGVVDVVGQDDHDDERQQPGQVDQDLHHCAHLRHRVLVDQVGHVQQRQHQLHCHDQALSHPHPPSSLSILHPIASLMVPLPPTGHLLSLYIIHSPRMEWIVLTCSSVDDDNSIGRMHHYTKSNNVEALSIYNQQFRNKQQQEQQGTRKHLLGLLSSFTREEEEVREQEVEDLCCYDRMKKLICKGGEKEEAQLQKDLISSIVIEQKINQLQAKFNKSEAKLRPNSQKKTADPIFIRRSCMIDNIKKHCLDKFLHHKQDLQAKELDDVRKWIEREVDERADEIIQERKMEFTHLKEEKASLEKLILTKTLEIESLKTRENSMKDYIRELEEKCQGKQESRRATVNSHSRNQSQGWEERFQEAFGGMSVEEVKRKLDFSVEKCLEQFDRVENRNQSAMKEKERAFQNKCAQLQGRIDKLQRRENELLGNLKNIKLNKQLSQVQINELCKAKQRLQDLQRLILSLYNEWYAERSDSQKKLMRVFGNLEENYSYDSMLKYIVDYGKKYSTNQKLNDFLFKVLRGVQKIKRVIYPEQCNEKLDALATMEKIEKWVKIKASQNKRFLPKKKTQNESKNDAYLDQPLQ